MTAAANSKWPEGWRWKLVWAALVVVGIGIELPRWWTVEARQESLSGWLCGIQPDALPLLFWLLAAPLVIWLSPTLDDKGNKSGWRAWMKRSAKDGEFDRGVGLCCVLLAALAWWATAVRVGDQLNDSPPSYHDEYSYLLQAETFQQGRTWNPVFAEMPQMFDQMHVLNEPDLGGPEGRFASRYFPGTGLWMLPFMSGNPVTGHQFAQVLVVLGVFFIGRELRSNGLGLLSAALAAVSPGLLIFSNLLLAHHPTLVGLMLFLWQYLRTQRTGSLLSALLTGVGLAFAMLCRPMTAAGFSFPAGIFFGWWWLSGRGKWMALTSEIPPSFWSRSKYAGALGGPLVLGFLAMLAYQKSITGSYLESPYQIYTDRYTPRHVYGFNNVVRGEQKIGPKVIENYDTWAVNLTPSVAATNVGVRLWSSWRWTFGVLPGVGTLLIWLLVPAVREGRGWWVVISAIVGLHVAHIPYWFTGIMDWHYVFETAPLWLLLAGAAIVSLIRLPKAMIWTIGFVTATVSVGLISVPPLWPARVDVAIEELKFPRDHYVGFRAAVDERRKGQDVLVLVIPDPDDRSIDYVPNPATLDGPVLVARWRGESVERIRELFPGRLLMEFDVKGHSLKELPP
ncbi:MAG: glycosyltransferase family 39 protein [Planctomycetaceae bacterium]|nr:glycosyltransferase family 39 protein [Planctomycetaceae bacterium]